MCFSTLLLYFLLREFGEVPQLPRTGNIELLFGLQHILSLPTANQPPIAARRAIADTFGFKHDNAHAELSEIQRRRQAGKACADDAHIGRQLLVQGWSVFESLRCRNVIAIGMPGVVCMCHVKNLLLNARLRPNRATVKETTVPERFEVNTRVVTRQHARKRFASAGPQPEAMPT